MLPEEARARTYLDTIAAQIHLAGDSTAMVVRSGLAARIIVNEAAARAASYPILLRTIERFGRDARLPEGPRRRAPRAIPAGLVQ